MNSEDAKLDQPHYRSYIAEINHDFMHWAGSQVLAIPYDISEDELDILLP